MSGGTSSDTHDEQDKSLPGPEDQISENESLGSGEDQSLSASEDRIGEETQEIEQSGRLM